MIKPRHGENLATACEGLVYVFIFISFRGAVHLVIELTCPSPDLADEAANSQSSSLGAKSAEAALSLPRST